MIATTPFVSQNWRKEKIKAAATVTADQNINRSSDPIFNIRRPLRQTDRRAMQVKSLSGRQQMKAIKHDSIRTGGHHDVISASIAMMDSIKIKIKIKKCAKHNSVLCTSVFLPAHSGEAEYFPSPSRQPLIALPKAKMRPTPRHAAPRMRRASSCTCSVLAHAHWRLPP